MRFLPQMLKCPVIALSFAMAAAFGRISCAAEGSANDIEIRSFLEVFDFPKDRGTIAVKIAVGGRTKTWFYGNPTNQWPAGYFTRMVHRGNFGAAPDKLRTNTWQVSLEYRRLISDGPSKTGLRGRVILYFPDGYAQEYKGEHIFTSGDGTDGFDLARTREVNLATTGFGSEGADTIRLARSSVITTEAAAAEAAFYARLWPPNSTLKIAFRGGTPAMRQMVSTVALEWTKHAAIKFQFGPASAPGEETFFEWGNHSADTSDIRVSFESGGNWAAVGTQAREMPGTNTINFSPVIFEDTNTNRAPFSILHEFGHVLGLSHNLPESEAADGFRWEDDAGYEGTLDDKGRPTGDTQGRNPGIYSYFAATASGGFPKEMVDEQFRDTCWAPLPAPPESIMIYMLPAAVLKMGEASRWFFKGYKPELSEWDKRIISIAYPSDPADNPIRYLAARGQKLLEDNVFDQEAMDRFLAQLLQGIGPVAATVTPPLKPEPTNSVSELTKGWTEIPDDSHLPIDEETHGVPPNAARFLREATHRVGTVCYIRAIKDFTHSVLGPKVKGEGFGTGVLVGFRQAITMNHVIPSDADAAAVELVFPWGNESKAFRLSTNAIIVSSAVTNTDFSLVRLEPNKGTLPSSLLGYYSLADVAARQNNLYPPGRPLKLRLIQYWGGDTEARVDENLRPLKLINDTFLAFLGRTRPGSSGSPIYSGTWLLLGLHRGRQETGDEPIEFFSKYAKGVRIDAVLRHIREYGRSNPQLLLDLGMESN